ncbi:MAG: bacillithiol biosynthesis deacetylase BshB1 [Acidobacteria bacterium]|nr:bacillithiol biosynthesis deacetylase BshB1 [Acidobacteriota bacterium]
MALDLLAIAAHPDDAELTCGGTLAKAVERGYRVGVLDLTRGEMGSRGTPADREQEAAEAARVLGIHLRENLGLPDARLESNLDSRLLVARKIRQHQPRVVILPAWEARHPDHSTCTRMAYEACFLAGLAQLELEGTPHRPFKIVYSAMYEPMRPSFVVDVTAQYELRKQAILCYRSQFGDQKTWGDISPRMAGLVDEVDLRCRYYGSLIGVEYGEAYTLKEMIQIDDLVTMPVRSI